MHVQSHINELRRFFRLIRHNNHKSEINMWSIVIIINAWIELEHCLRKAALKTRFSNFCFIHSLLHCLHSVSRLLHSSPPIDTAVSVVSVNITRDSKFPRVSSIRQHSDVHSIVDYNWWGCHSLVTQALVLGRNGGDYLINTICCVWFVRSIRKYAPYVRGISETFLQHLQTSKY